MEALLFVLDILAMMLLVSWSAKGESRGNTDAKG